MSSQKEKKDAYIHIRIQSDLKKELIEKAEKLDKNLSEYVIDSVMTNNNKNVMTFNNSKKNDPLLKTLAQGLNEFNKLLTHNAEHGSLLFPDTVNEDKINEAIKYCRTILI